MTPKPGEGFKNSKVTFSENNLTIRLRL
jgi:hypothetical protein